MAFDKSKFIDQFKAETRERIQALNLGLLKLEKAPQDRELLNAMMREAHSIKGGSRMMGYKRIADITHKMEDGLQRALNNELSLTQECFEVLFKCLDALEPLLQDKVTWEDNGISRDFTEDLCQKAEKAFSPKTQAPVLQAPESPKIPEPSADRPQPVPQPQSSEKDEEPAPGPEESIRVDLGKLDRLINLSGELLISKIRLEELTEGISKRAESQMEENPVLAGLVKDLSGVTDHFDVLTGDLQTEMMKVRMLPVGHLFNTFPRAMRDLARGKGKEIDFVIQGEETQLDKAILDEVKVPLMHLLRNAVDHGMESPEERKAKNKSSSGKITLSAEREGSQVMIAVTDDGRGIDVEKVKEHAVAKGLVSREHIQYLAEEQVFNLIFTPGFSTEEGVSDISGRG
jgi:two-component system chemotaxis sensor kinase CheA